MAVDERQLSYLDCVVEADVNTLDWQTVFDDQVFDCLMFADVLEHLVDPWRCLSLALQRLAPGGCVIVSLPNVRHVSVLWGIFFMGTFPRRDRGIFDRTHLRWFTYADAKGLLLESGLVVPEEFVFKLKPLDDASSRARDERFCSQPRSMCAAHASMV